MNIVIFIEAVAIDECVKASMSVAEHPLDEFRRTQPSIAEGAIFKAIGLNTEGTSSAIQSASLGVVVINERGQGEEEIELLGHVTAHLEMTVQVIAPAYVHMATGSTHRLISGGLRIGFTTPAAIVGVTAKLKCCFRLAVEILTIEVSDRGDSDVVIRHHASKRIEHRVDVHKELISIRCGFDVELKSHTIHLDSALVYTLRVLLVSLDEIVGRAENALLLNKNFRVSTNKNSGHFIYSSENY